MFIVVNALNYTLKLKEIKHTVNISPIGLNFSIGMAEERPVGYLQA